MLNRSIWFVGLLFIASCLDEPDCYQLSNNYIGITFKKIFDGKVDTVSFVSITSPSSDSVFYPFTFATSIQLELNPHQSFSNFTMETLFFESFQLDLGYKSVVQFVSEDCGIRTTLSGLEVNQHTFDSLRMLTPVLADPAQINLEVYRCPRSNQLKLAFKKLVEGVEMADSVQLNNVTADYPVNFYFPGEKTTSINLPVNPQANSTTFTFEFTDGSFKTLTVQHTRTISNKYALCPDWTLFSDLINSGSTFSQVIPARDSIQDPPITNFAIYK